MYQSNKTYLIMQCTMVICSITTAHIEALSM